MKRSTLNIRWVEEFCRIPEGKDVGKPFRYQPFQKKWMRGIYDGEVSEAILSTAKKNGKTTFVSSLIQLHLAGPEARQNSQLISAAQSREQASLTFLAANKSIELGPLSDVVRVRESTKHMFCPQIGTTYKAISAEASTAHGLSPIFVVHDELGQVKGPTSDLYTALESARGTYDNSVSIVISTQAPYDGDLLSLLIDSARDFPSPSVFLSVYEAPKTDNPFAESTFKKASPAYGKFLSPGQMRKMAEKARRIPSLEPGFRNLNLNQRVSAKAKTWLSSELWTSALADMNLDDFEGEECWGGLDLAISSDLSSLVLVFPDPDGSFAVFSFFWLPEGQLARRQEEDGVPYSNWHRDGYLECPLGKVMNWEAAANVLGQVCSKFNMKGIAYDRAKMEYLRPEMDKLGAFIPMVEHPQGFYKSKETGLWMPTSISNTEELLLEEKLWVAVNPVMNWCVSNTVTVSSQIEPADRKFEKVKTKGKIDGSVALVMAIGLMTSKVSGVVESVYNTRGLVVI